MKEIKNKSIHILRVENKIGGQIEEILRSRFVDEHKQIQTIADELGVTYKTVVYWLKQANITSRRLNL